MTRSKYNLHSDLRNMKRIFTCLLITLYASSANAFTFCNGMRYDKEVFSGVQVTSNIVYGWNTNFSGGLDSLRMDIYQPAGDTLAQRPLIVWVHGGSFVGGTKADVDVVALSNAFAKRGYVCASIDYRLGVSFPPTTTGTQQAVFRAVHDLKAAIRFFRKDAATADNYRIDPNMIFAGGSSAGAFTALHLAYLDEPSEVPPSIDTVLMGGMEGNSGNPGYSSGVNAIVNLCGALGDATVGVGEGLSGLLVEHGGNLEHLLAKGRGDDHRALLKHGANVVDAGRKRPLHGSGAFLDDRHLATEDLVDLLRFHRQGVGD